MYKLFVLATILFGSTLAYGHSGRTDSNGGHTNRKTGEYHYHSGSKSKSSDKSTKSNTYSRSLYGYWIDADGDCQNTRQEVLIAESLEPVVLDRKGCKVISGKWLDLYTGQVFTDPGKLDIDHFIPLAEAHRSGANLWTSAKRRLFTNDLVNKHALIAVSASANRSKRDKDIANWLPPNKSFHCEYINRWIAIKNYWNLDMDTAEIRFLQTHPCLSGNE